MDECREQTEFFPLWTTLYESVFAWVKWVFNSACKWVGLNLADAESPGSGVINSSWRLGSVKLGDRLSLFLILFLPGPLAGGPLIGSENDRDRELWPAVSGQMPLTHCSQLAIIHHLDFTKCQQKCPLSQHEFLFAIHLTVIWCYSEWSWIFIENKWREGLDFIQWESIEW